MDRLEMNSVEPSPTQEHTGRAQPQTAYVVMGTHGEYNGTDWAERVFLTEGPAYTFANDCNALLRDLRDARPELKRGHDGGISEASWRRFRSWEMRCAAAISELGLEEGAAVGAHYYVCPAPLSDGSASDRVTEAEDLSTGRRDTNNTSLPSEEKEETR